MDVIAVGDSTQDIFLGMHEAGVQCDLDGHNCRICFDYAEKIPVDTKTNVPGVGNAANHAVGISRLGLKAGLYTIVGSDAQGEEAKKVFEQENVVTKYIVTDEVRGTNLSVVINYRGERTIFVYHEPRTYQLPELEEAKWMYVTSVSGDGVEQLHQHVEHYLAAHPNVQLAFNPGTYQLRLGKEKLTGLLKRTQLLFLNREESARLTGLSVDDVKALLSALHALGPATVVVTDGSAGAYVSDGKTTWFSNIFSGPVVERTGAGDAYGSGFLAALLYNKPFPEAMGWGNANSTSVVRYIGAREGLLTIEKLEALIQENKSITAQPYA